MCYKLFFIFCIEIVHASIAVHPRNLAVVAGKGMKMECRTVGDAKVLDWTLQRPGEKSERTLVFSWNDASRIDESLAHIKSENTVNGPIRIYSNDAHLDDAGLYTCAVQNGSVSQPIKYSAHLVVIEKEPHCEIKSSSQKKFAKAGKVVFLECTVAFRGYLTPAVEWKRHCNKGENVDHRDQILTKDIELNEVGTSSVTSSVQLPLDYHKESCYVSFEVLFKLQNSSTNEATDKNAPSYSYTWRSTDVNDHNRSGKRTALIVTLVIVCVIAIIFIVCCVVCTWYRDTISGLLRCVADSLQRETTTNASRTTNENELKGNANKNSTENDVNKSEPQDDQTYEELDDCYDSEKCSSCQTTGTICDNQIYDLKRQSSTASENCSAAISTQKHSAPVCNIYATGISIVDPTTTNADIYAV